MTLCHSRDTRGHVEVVRGSSWRYVAVWYGTREYLTIFCLVALTYIVYRYVAFTWRYVDITCHYVALRGYYVADTINFYEGLTQRVRG